MINVSSLKLIQMNFRTDSVRNSWLPGLLVVVLIISGCSNNGPAIQNTNGNNAVVIDLNDRKQTIRNFGASDAWTCQFVGLWPDAKRNQVADWLFSMETDSNGQPRGIGLSLWRFNIGAGSAAQSNISDEWRRAEGFLKDDLSYDWSKQAGQRWFMHAAKERGVGKFVGFTNSPPVQLTKNGKAFSSNGEEANIPEKNYVPFAKFLANVSKKFQEDGIPFQYLSPFNEPQWDWTGNNQEGSPYRNDEIYAITRVLDSILTKENIPAKIQIAEAGKLNYLFENADKPTRGEQIKTFFSQSSPLYLGDMPTVDHVITGHSYFTSAPDATMKTIRENLSTHLARSSVPLEFWQSEYCILGDQEEVKAEGKDTGIAPALYIARLIHHDLALANASAWQWWIALSVYDYKDGLVYADKNKTDGNVEDTKALWAFGNFSRFVRPGAVRVGVSSDNRAVNNTKGAMISAYVDDSSRQVIVVVVNNSPGEATLNLQLSEGSVGSWKPYITSAEEGADLRPLPATPGEKPVTIPGTSVVTFVGDWND
jgi:O-glycosyl hydrolase